MLHIEQTPVWCKVSKTASIADIRWLHDVLSISTQSFVRGKIHFYKLRLFDKKRMRFPSGLLNVVQQKALASKQSIDVFDSRPDTKSIKMKPLDAAIYGPNGNSELFDFQKEAVRAILDKKNGIIKLPTGSGKTDLGIALSLCVNCKVLWLVDEKSLAQQAMARWTKITGRPAGLLGDSVTVIGQFTVAMLQSVRAKLQVGDKMIKNYLRRVGCVIIDEVHVVAAKTYYKTVISIPNAVYRVGLSATPTGRSDKKDAYVIGATGPIRYKANIDQLVELGRLAKAVVIFYRYPGAVSMDSDDHMKWHVLYDMGIVRNAARNRAVVRICKITPRPVLVFFDRKRHGFALLDVLQQEGFRVDIVYGAHDGEQRIKLAGQLNSGKLDVLLASKVFNKGIDIPEIRSAINAAGYKAVITSMQKMGRPMRASKETGKNQFVYWDMVDEHHNTLLAHSRHRARVYRAAGLDVMVVDQLAKAADKLVEIGLVDGPKGPGVLRQPPLLERPLVKASSPPLIASYV